MKIDNFEPRNLRSINNYLKHKIKVIESMEPFFKRLIKKSISLFKSK